MTKDKYFRAEEIIRNHRMLNVIRDTLSYNPRIVKEKVFMKGDYRSISFGELDDETRKGLCKVIEEYIEKRGNELDEELKNL